MRVLCLGSGVCAGARAPLGWPETLGMRHGVYVANVSSPSWRAVDVVRAVPQAPDDDWRWVIIQAGDRDAKGAGTPPQVFAHLLAQAHDAALMRWPGAQVAVCTPTPIDPGRTKGYGRSSRRWVERATREVRAVGFRTTVFLHALPPDLLTDGVHVGRDGAEHIADRIHRTMRGG